MKTMYRVSTWGEKITKIQVTKETEHTVWYDKTYESGTVKNFSERKNTSDNKHFETFEEAKAHLVRRYKEIISMCEEKIRYNEKELMQVLLLEE